VTALATVDRGGSPEVDDEQPSVGSPVVRNQMLVSLRGRGGELGKLKTLTYGFTNFAPR
jgi:hypothetical protein